MARTEAKPIQDYAGAVMTIPESPERSFRAAFLKAKSEFKPVLKAQDNPFFKSSYASLEDYHHACDKALQANGFAIHQLFDSDGTHNYIVTKLTHIDGWTEVSRILLKSKDDTDPQKVGSAITYFRRYALAAILGTGAEDDDGNTASEREGTNESKTITDAQAKRLFAIAKSAGRTEQDIKDVLAHFRYQSTRDISKQDYDLIIAALEPRK